MNRRNVYIGMAAIFIINVAIFGFIFSNQSHAIPTGLQSFNNESGSPRFLDHIYADFALTLDKPMDVMKTNEFIYVTDTNNKRVQVFDLAGAPLFTFGEAGSGPGEFNFPYGIAGDNNGKVYVADMYNGKISVHDAKGDFIEYFAEDLSDENGIKSPAGIRIMNDLVYVSDIQAGKIFVFNMDGELQLELGENGSEEGQFSAPNAVVADAEGYIYVVDTGNQRIQIFDADGNFESMFNGSSTGVGEALFVNPRGIGINSRGTIFVVSNLTHIVHAFDKDGKELQKFGGIGQGPGQLYLPNGLFIDDRDTIYVTDTLNQRVSTYK